MKHSRLVCVGVLIAASVGQTLGAGAAQIPAALHGTWLSMSEADLQNLTGCDGLRATQAESLTISADTIAASEATSTAAAVSELSSSPRVWRLDIIEEAEGGSYEYPMIYALVGEHLTAIGSASVDGIDVPVINTYARCG